jgi:hypothetical protein
LPRLSKNLPLSPLHLKHQHALINNDKWNSFDNVDLLLQLKHSNLKITDVEIKDPDNPAKLKPAKLITFYL